ncbi:MAG: aspartate aminotransferase family protein [Alphaproteobacteria bacterium]
MRHLGNSLASRDIASLVHPYTNLKAHQTEGPLVVMKGKGVHIYDEAGKEYIEGMAGLWCASLGFDEQRLADAAQAAMGKLGFYHMFAHKSHEPGIELAERLLAMAPVPMSKVFFGNSGSEANDTAIKLVWYYNNALGRPDKKKIISRQRAYHGVTIASASLTGLPANHADFDLPIKNIIHTDAPHYYKGAQPGESEEQFATRLADNLENLILKEGPETCAAFFAEPVMGAGGVVVPPKTYFEKIQAVLKKYDLLFVCDEVICGFGRTGNMFGTQTFDLKPDMIVVAKALSAAFLPISGLMISERIYQAMVKESEKIGTFGHGFTYSGHPVCAAVAVETLKIYQERDIVSHVRKVMAPFQKEFRALANEDFIGEVRGVGLIGALEFVADKATKRGFKPPGAVGRYFYKRAEEAGLITRNLVDSIALCPPLIINEAEIGEMFCRMRKAVAETQAWIRKEKIDAAA